MNPIFRNLSLVFTVSVIFVLIFYPELLGVSVHSESHEMLVDDETMTAKDTRDGQVYKVVLIGEQVWLAENFKYQGTPMEVCYDNLPQNCNTYGFLYSWEVAQNIAPEGWHVPSKTDWETLLANLGQNENKIFANMIDGGKSGFDVKLGGYMRDDNYFDILNGTVFWSSTESDSKNAWACYTYRSLQSTGLISYKNNCGFYVRLIKNTSYD